MPLIFSQFTMEKSVSQNIVKKNFCHILYNDNLLCDRLVYHCAKGEEICMINVWNVFIFLLKWTKFEKRERWDEPCKSLPGLSFVKNFGYYYFWTKTFQLFLLECVTTYTWESRTFLEVLCWILDFPNVFFESKKILAFFHVDWVVFCKIRLIKIRHK